MATNIGAIAFIGGIILSVLISIFGSALNAPWVIFILALLGLVVGLLNVRLDERKLFLIAALTFMLSFQALGSILGTFLLGWDAVPRFFEMMVTFIAPAAAVVAFKTIWQLAMD